MPWQSEIISLTKDFLELVLFYSSRKKRERCGRRRRLLFILPDFFLMFNTTLATRRKIGVTITSQHHYQIFNISKQPQPRNTQEESPRNIFFQKRETIKKFKNFCHKILIYEKKIIDLRDSEGHEMETTQIFNGISICALFIFFYKR